MSSKKYACALLLSGCSLYANAQMYFSNSYESELKYLTQSGEIQSYSHQLQTEFEYSASNYAINGIVRAFADTENNLFYDEDAMDSFSSASKPWVNDKYGADLRELYLTYYHQNHEIKLGKQQVAWGETDGVRILDVVNPLDYREFLLKDSEEMRIPIWMLNYSLLLDNMQFQLLVIPDNTVSLLSTQDYASRSPINAPTFIVDNEIANVTRQSVTGLHHQLSDWDRGFNVSFSTNNGDFSVVYLNQLQDIPIIKTEYQGDDIDVEVDYYRRNLMGMSYSNAFSSWVVRSELALSDANYVYLKNPRVDKGVDKRKSFDYALALDWSGLDDATVTVQFSQSILSGDDALITRDKVDSTLAFVWDQYFDNQTYHIQLLSLQGLNKMDNMTTFEATWFYHDELSFSTGVDTFWGDKEGVFGQYHEQNRLYLTLEYVF